MRTKLRVLAVLVILLGAWLVTRSHDGSSELGPTAAPSNVPNEWAVELIDVAPLSDREEKTLTPTAVATAQPDPPANEVDDTPTMSGRVIDVHGVPVEGATVELTSLSVDQERKSGRVDLFSHMNWRPITATTDADGRYTITADERAVARISAIKQGVGAALRRGGPDSTIASITRDDIVLERITIGGTVYYPDGNPARFLRLNVGLWDHDEESRGTLPILIFDRWVRTDEHGRFEAIDVMPGEYWITGHFPHHVATRVNPPLETYLQDRSDGEYRVLPAGRTDIELIVDSRRLIVNVIGTGELDAPTVRAVPSDHPTNEYPNPSRVIDRASNGEWIADFFVEAGMVLDLRLVGEAGTSVSGVAIGESDWETEVTLRR